MTPIPLPGSDSADRNFIVQGINEWRIQKDNMLTVDGTVSVNAALQGGSFVNQRTLCGDNLHYPAFTTNGHLEMLLNAPGFLKTPQSITQEVVP